MHIQKSFRSMATGSWTSAERAVPAAVSAAAFASSLLLALVADGRVRLLGVSILSAVFAVFFILWLTARVRTSRRRKAFFADVLDGGIDLRSRLDPAREGRLAIPVNALLERLNEDMLWIAASTRKFGVFSADIGFSSRSLSERSRRLRDAVVDSASKVGTLIASFREVGGEVVSLSSRLRESDAAARELTDRATVSLEVFRLLGADVSAADSEAARGAVKVKTVSDASASFITALRELEAVTEGAVERVRRIGGALGAIEDIAERTRLLSVNASIEAARAGVAGKGFAVVAAEIRALAERSGATLAETTGLLGEIGAAVERSAGTARRASGDAGRLVVETEAALASFRSISDHVGSVDRRYGDFSKAFDAQLDASTRVGRVAREAAEAIDRVASTITRQSAAYDDLGAAVADSSERADRANEAAETLARLGAYLRIGGYELGRVIRRFRLDPDASVRKYGRNGRREVLLYNLEVSDMEGESIGNVGDLSTGGMLLLSERDLAIGSSLRLRIESPGVGGIRDPVTLDATVRSFEKDGEFGRAGLCFDDPDAATVAAIKEIITELALSDDRGTENPEEAEELEALD